MRSHRFPHADLPNVLRSLLASVLFAGLLVLLPSDSFAAWGAQGIPVGAPPGDDQLTPAILGDGAGGLFTAWADLRGTSEDIYAQHLDANGNPLWGPTGIGVSTASGLQYDPKMISDGAGGMIIAWHDQRNTGNAIYAQRLNASGVAQWTTNGVKIVPINCIHSFQMTSDGAGGAMFAVEQCNDFTSADIVAQRVNGAGSIRWGANGLNIAATVNDQTAPGIALADDGSGSAFIGWADNRDGTPLGWNVFAQRVSAAGAIQWQVNGLPVALNVDVVDYWPIQVVGDGADGAILTWQDLGIGTFKVWAQRINSSGAGQWMTNGVRVSSALGAQYYPVVVKDGAGGELVVWYDARSDTAGDLYAQRLSSAGAPVWPAVGVPVCTAPGEQFLPSIANDGSGGVMAVWQDARTDSANDIYAQHISTAGGQLWGTQGAAIGRAPSYQVFPAMALDGSGGLVAVWQDYRTHQDFDIYATRVPNGAVAVARTDPASDRVLTVAPSLVSGSRATVITARGVHAGSARVIIVDASGRAVFARDVTPEAEGDVAVRWDGRASDGRPVATGVYAVSLVSDGETRTRSVVVVR
jgi:hypothetical protein